ncbi:MULTISPECIES: LysR family transcriptional regulator [Comamonadaceae]|jgi:DNA-binding transcriptional LysR family regulator|uniref:LysR family transcriptional regulator n=1 Tax=Comamonadaceae TaxID=80864 RepID=UPI0001D9E3AF|nr:MULTISPECIES: LysR family transcriptional regulator [Comamonadaceae]ADV00456.1 LysR substrate-binding protein [Alicycliphilus denitrificans BC]MBS0435336.1 LysR family transcriptional regulator [Pseudomonadota bacterium]MBS0499599.1 LysR family transcriptional regulator [Pseudomonadota bacterium]MBZ0226273.1 LysR family transcriptional regulator [Comamonas sp.]
MDLRHIRAFVAVAEELHFGRAAKRLHIEQSPLSRTIRALETDLGVVLLRRTARGASLTWAGQIFLQDARRIMLAVEQTEARARAAAEGCQDTLRIALAGDIGRSRLSTLLALCRQEAPQVNIRLSEMPIAQLVHGLNSDLFDAGFAMIDDVGAGIIATPVWVDPLMVALSARHPLLVFKEVPLEEVVRYPLVLCDPQSCKGCRQQRERLFRSFEVRPMVDEYITTHGLMLTLVAAGYGVGFSSAAHFAGCQQADVVARPLVDRTASLTTYLLRPERGMGKALRQFIEHAKRVGLPSGA